MTGVARMTVEKLLRELGYVCAMYRLSEPVLPENPGPFTYAKAKNVARESGTWTAIDADTKLVPCWLVGGRDAGYATEFLQNLAGRLAHSDQRRLGCVELTSDGL